MNYFRLLNREMFEPINGYNCVVRALMFAFAVLENSCYCPKHIKLLYNSINKDTK